MLRRIAGGLVLLLVLTFVVFGLIALSPGSPAQALLGTRAPTPELVAAINAKYHLDAPFLVQYWHWLGGVAQLDLGESISVETGADVMSVIGGRLALSVQLGIYAFVLMICVGIPAGMVAGIRHGGRLDRAVSSVASVLLGAPSYVLGLLLLYVFGATLGWFPAYGVGRGFVERVAHLTLPAFALAGLMVAVIVRQTRAASLSVMQQDYVTFARLRGLSPAHVLVRYAFRNSALPVLTISGLLLISVLTGGVFVENVFSIPGAGQLLLTAVTNKDVPLIQGMALVLGTFVVVGNLLVDLAVLILDPRTRFSARGGM